jgi:hypothetical protein
LANQAGQYVKNKSSKFNFKNENQRGACPNFAPPDF